MAIKIVIEKITFNPTPQSNQTVSIKYKKTADADVPESYTVVTPSVDVTKDGALLQAVEITNLLANTSYTVVAINSCNGKEKRKTIVTQEPITYVWLEDTFVCESDNVVNVVLTATGFSTPQYLFYNEAKQRVYGVDADSASGNVFWFNPNTFASYASTTFYSGIKDYIYTAAFDKQRNKIYMAGLDTGGLMVFDMNSDAYLKTVPYGLNVDYGRLLVTLQGNNIYCSYRNGATDDRLFIINADSLTVTSDLNIDAIPSGNSYFTNGYDITAVENDLWVTHTQRRSASSIGVYNAQLTTLITTIPLPEATFVTNWGGNTYWGGSFYDKDKNRFYLHDVGSNKLFILNTLTKTVIKTLSFNNREGKGYTGLAFKVDPNTGKMYLSYVAYNSPSDIDTKKRTYVFNRDTLEIEVMIADTFLGSPVFQIGSPNLWGAYGGVQGWVGTSGWNTDGTITKLTY